MGGADDAASRETALSEEYLGLSLIRGRFTDESQEPLEDWHAMPLLVSEYWKPWDVSSRFPGEQVR
jgi:hypothetical protein